MITDCQFCPNIVAGLIHGGAGAELARHPVFREAISSQSREGNREAIAVTIQRLKVHTDDTIFQALADLDWRTLLDKPLAPALMNWQQVKEMLDTGRVEIGSHTCSHRRLNGDVAEDALHHEMVHSEALLEEQSGRPDDVVCCPKGDYSGPGLALGQRHCVAAA